jgi:DHA3 family tetracycline resistance protein-like MFS transporter
MSQEGRIGIFRPLKIRDFALLWTGLSVSLTGDGIFLISMGWQVYKMTNDPRAFGLVGFAWMLPTVILLLYSGVLSDRISRRGLMISADIVRALAIGSMGLLTVAGTVRLWQLVALAAVYGVGDAMFGPAYSAIVPDLVPKDLLVQANSLAQFVRPLAATLLGPLLGGVLSGTLGTGWAFIADAVTFAFSAAMILAMHPIPRILGDSEPTTTWQDLREGLVYVRNRTWLWASMAAATVSLLCFWGPMDVLVPFVIKNDLKGSATAVGLVFAAGGVGSVLAAALIGQRGLPKRPLTVTYLAWTLGTVLLAGFGLFHQLWPMFLVSALSSACFTILMINWFTVVQRLVPSALLGRVSSLDWMISTGGVPLSFILTGQVAAALGARRTLILAGVAGAVVIVAVVLLIPGVLSPERDGSLDQAASS